MTAEEARARVSRGAALLDQRRPGWAGELDLDTLHIESCDRCVLGQLFGGFFVGTKALGIKIESPQLGFVSDLPDTRADVLAQYGELRIAWSEAVHARLASPAAWTHREPERELIGT